MNTPRWYMLNKDGMTDAKQPAQFDWATELSDVQGHVTLSEQEAHEIGARLRRLHAYCMELEAQVIRDCMSEQEAHEIGARLRRLHAYCTELEAQVIRDCMTNVQKPAEIEHVADDVSKNGAELNMSAQQPAPAPQQEAQEPVAWYVTGGSRLLDENEAKAEARHIGGTARAIPVYTTPQPSPAAQGDALDALEAARQYGAESWDDWLKDKVDAAIDAARAAQEGKSHGN